MSHRDNTFSKIVGRQSHAGIAMHEKAALTSEGLGRFLVTLWAGGLNSIPQCVGSTGQSSGQRALCSKGCARLLLQHREMLLHHAPVRVRLWGASGRNGNLT